MIKPEDDKTDEEHRKEMMEEYEKLSNELMEEADQGRRNAIATVIGIVIGICAGISGSIVYTFSHALTFLEAVVIISFWLAVYYFLCRFPLFHLLHKSKKKD